MIIFSEHPPSTGIISLFKGTIVSYLMTLKIKGVCVLSYHIRFMPLYIHCQIPSLSFMCFTTVDKLLELIEIDTGIVFMWNTWFICSEIITSSEDHNILLFNNLRAT